MLLRISQNNSPNRKTLKQILIVSDTAIFEKILSKVEKSALAINSLAIPRDYGTIKERSNGTNGKLVLYIQDAHCNYEAQANIAKILDNLIKEHHINFAYDTLRIVK